MLFGYLGQKGKMKSSSVIGVWILECIEYEVVFSFLQVEMGVDKRIGEAFHVFFFITALISTRASNILDSGILVNESDLLLNNDLHL